MGEHADKWIWETLLVQAVANLRQTQAFLRQSEANLETARTLHLHTQHKLCQESVVNVEPDRLEAWFVADDDAEAGTVIAEQIVQQAESIWQDKQATVGTTGGLGNADGKCPSPAAAVHANAAKPVVGTKRREPSVLELLTARGDLTVGVDSKAIVGAVQATTAKRRDQATSKASPVAEAFEALACELARPPEQEEKGIKEKIAIHNAAAEKVAVELPAADKAGVEAETSGSRAAEAFEARASELPRPPEDEAAEKAAKVAIQKAATEKVAEEKPAAEKAVVEAATSGSRATEAFEARASELPRPPEDTATSLEGRRDDPGKTSLEGRRDDPGHLGEDAKEHVSQDDRASHRESGPEGIEVAVTSWPKRSVETDGSSPEAAKGGWAAQDLQPSGNEGGQAVANWLDWNWVEGVCEREIDSKEARCIDNFRKGVFREEKLREALGVCATVRAVKGLGPSKIREIDIVEARLEIAKSLRKAKGGVGETTKKAKNHRPHLRQKG